MSIKPRGATKSDVKTLGSRLEATIKENTRELVAHFNASQGKQNEWIKQEFKKVNERFNAVDERFNKVDERFEEIQAELEAIKEMLVMRQELRNLVYELKAKGIKLDESRIFARP